MSNWKKVVFPLVGAVVVVALLTAWQLPQVRAAFLGPGQASGGVTLQEQPQDQKPWIGISLVNNGPRVKERLGLTTDQGVVIARVAPDSPGATAGLAEKDVITAVDGTAVTTAEEVTKAVQAKKVGDTVKLTILRGSQPSQDITVTLGAAPESPKLRQPKGGVAPLGGLGGILGANPLENLRSGKMELTDKDGKTRTLEVVAGTVQSASSTSISVLPNGDTAARTFQVTGDTRFGFRGKTEDLKQGDRVLVMAEGGQALSVVGANILRAPNMAPLFRGLPFHRFAPWGGGQPPASGSSY